MLGTRDWRKEAPAETVRLWKDDASVEGQPAVNLKALRDLWGSFQGMDQARMMHH